MPTLHSNAPPPDDPVVAKIISYTQEMMAEYQLPGVAIGIVRAREVLYHGGFGVADLETGQPVTPATLFNIGSISKSFTAIAVVQLVEEGKVHLKAKVTEYLPYFRLEDERYQEITIRHLLSHTSGLPYEPIETDPPWKAYNYENPESGDEALERYVRGLSTLRLLDNPGSGTLHYSNIAFSILGDVVAKVSGQSYEEYMQAKVLFPLGMTSSTYLPEEADPTRLARGHQRDVSSGEVTVWPFLPYNRTGSPHDGLFTCVDDLCQAALALLNHGERQGRSILTAQSLATMWTVVVRTDANRFLKAYGLGWILTDIDGHHLPWHPGRNPGFSANFILAPDDGIAVATLVNSCREAGDGEPIYAMDLGNRAMEWLLGLDS